MSKHGKHHDSGYGGDYHGGSVKYGAKGKHNKKSRGYEGGFTRNYGTLGGWGRSSVTYRGFGKNYDGHDLSFFGHKQHASSHSKNMYGGKSVNSHL